MSTFLQSSFNARSAENTSSIISPGNSTQTALGAPNGSFTGAWVPSAFYSVLQITAKADSLIQILVEQSFLGVVADQVSDAFYNTQEDVNILRAAPFYAYITLPFMRILVSNIDTIENTIFELATKLTSTPPPQNLHVIIDSGDVTIVGPLPEGTNSIGYVRDTAYNVTASAWQALQIDDGNLKVEETNSAAIKTAVESINTNVVLCDTDNVVIESGSISVNNFPATQPISGSVSITGTAQVQDLPLENIAGTNAPRPVYNMVVGNWYRVASAGNTAGAVWIQIGAPLFNGANTPDVGVLFQCLYLYLNYATTGTVWDEPYNTWEADNLIVVAQNLQVIETNSASILAKETSIDAKITICNTSAVVITSGTVTEINSADILAVTDSIDAKITACNTGAVVISSGSVSVNNFPATQPISGSVSISGTAQVQDVQLENIAGTNAPRPVYNMVVGNWYRVASAGNTAGAVWIQIGAPLFNGASTPDVGVLFQCLYLYLNYATTGTVWDAPYNTWEADNLVVVAQNLQVVEANSADILAATDSIDAKITACDTGAVVISSGSVSVSNFPATQPISGTVTETNSTNILAEVTSIDAKITACNTGAVVVSSGTINTQSSGNASSQTSVPTVPITAGVKWNSPSTPMANYSMVQVAIKASATSITTSMVFGIEYSPNNTDWFSYGEVLAFTNGGSLNILTAGAAFTAMPYIRVSYDPPAMSTDTAANVVVYFLKKT